ncbi:MAG: hypothetical protein K2X74_20475 [Acetobacteraceae bacterium]|nr:hypothetical protein [Acetobacteraceae bacterium]
MAYRGDDLLEYPGSDKPALTDDFAALAELCEQMNVSLTHETGGHFFAPATRRINIDTKTASARGFVSVGHLTDEFLHAWNQMHGRGKHVPAAMAEQHVAWGTAAARDGTRSLGTNQNRCFHKLEALNFLNSQTHIPRFIWRIPHVDLRVFALSWVQDC